MNDNLFGKEFAKELELETASTLKCLERIPADLFGYKPHPSSMELGYLATLVAEIPLWISYMITKGDIDFATFDHFQPKTTKDLTDHFMKNVADAKAALSNLEEGALDEDFHLKNKGEILFTASKREQVESTINHMVHHRGQLTVYMRMNEIAVPSIYGPSADDKNYKSVL